MENYARLMAGLAADLGCDVVVGHSMGANVALEMAGARQPTVTAGRQLCGLRARCCCGLMPRIRLKAALSAKGLP